MSMDAIHKSKEIIFTERNFIKIPLHYGSPIEEHNASRFNILMVDYSHFSLIEVKGDRAYDFMNRIVAGDLSVIRDEQALYTVMLDTDGRIKTDLYILCDDERFVLISEWNQGEALTKTLKELGAEEEIEINCLNDEKTTILFEGPYAWELLSEMFGYDVLGLPFMEFMPVEDGVLLRAGKHGEFSYKLLVDKVKAPEIWENACDLGKKYDLKCGGLDFQNLSRLENPCWDPTRVGEFSSCPIELQMQWAVRYDKDEFVGKNSLLEKLESGVAKRVVGFRMIGETEPINIGDEVFIDNICIGKVITCGFSKAAEGYIGQALILSEYAYAGIEGYSVNSSSGLLNVSTCGIPFVQNFSFLVNPAEHSYVDKNRPKNLIEQMQRKS